MEEGGIEGGRGGLSFREMRCAGRNLRRAKGLHSVHLVTLNPVANEKGWIIGIPVIGIHC